MKKNEPEDQQSAPPPVKYGSQVLDLFNAHPELFSAPSSAGLVEQSAPTTQIAKVAGRHRCTVSLWFRECPAVTVVDRRATIDLKQLDPDLAVAVPATAPTDLAVAVPATAPTDLAVAVPATADLAGGFSELLSEFLPEALHRLYFEALCGLQDGDLDTALSRASLAAQLLEIAQQEQLAPKNPTKNVGFPKNVGSDNPTKNVGNPTKNVGFRDLSELSEIKNPSFNSENPAKNAGYPTKNVGFREKRRISPRNGFSAAPAERGVGGVDQSASNGQVVAEEGHKEPGLPVAERGFSADDVCGPAAASRLATKIIGPVYHQQHGSPFRVGGPLPKALGQWPTRWVTAACEGIAADIAEGNPMRDPAAVLVTAARKGWYRYFPIDDPTAVAATLIDRKVSQFEQYLSAVSGDGPELSVSDVGSLVAERLVGNPPPELLDRLLEVCGQAGYDTLVVKEIVLAAASEF